MDIHQLECFIAVAQSLNFTEAAKRIHIVQSAVSHNISELEKELGLKLFIRKKHSIELTSAGECLLKEAYNITSLTRETTNIIRRFSMGVSGKIRVGYVFEPIVDCMIENFKDIYEKYPEIEVNYNTYDSISLSKMLDNFDIDIAFARIITINHLENKIWIPVYTDPLYLVVSKENPISSYSCIDIEMLRNESIILMNRLVNPGMFDMVVQICMDSGFTPKIIDSANDFITPIMMAEIGMGVVMLPGQFRKFIPENLLFIPISNKSAYHEISVVWHKKNPNPSLKIF